MAEEYTIQETGKKRESEDYVIQKTRKKRLSEDYAFLRDQGIRYIAKLAGRIWTDYNTHDPGITTLELLCYAITELSYRNAHCIEDILANDNNNPVPDAKCFYTAAQIFPCNPVTIIDFRKLLVDIRGVKNAWLKTKNISDYKSFYPDYDNSVLTYTNTNNEPVELKGLYNVIVKYEEGKTEEENREIKQKANREITDKLNDHRNLCEDFVSITDVGDEEIGICAEIEVTMDADIDSVLAEIYYRLQQYFSPPVNFYTMEEMLDRGKGIEEIFEGPLLDHGFIDNDEIEEADLRTELRVSDMINFIMDIEGVTAVKSILLSSYIDGAAIQENKDWILTLSGGDRAPRLEIGRSKVIFYKDILPYIANREEVKKKLDGLNESRKKYKLDGHMTDIPIPVGNNRNISDYSPVQHEFPLCYGIGEAGLADSETDLRKAQAKQFKAYLLFFEQLLADFFSQLAHVKELFSFDENVHHTYFTTVLSNIQDIEGLYLDYNDYKNSLQGLAEDKALFEKRRNRLLDHLMARFSEEITEYSLLLFSLMGKAAGAKLIKDKIAFLEDYPLISAERGKAFNYKDRTAIWNTDNVSGMKKRICRLLGFENYERREYATDKLTIEKIGPDKYVIKLVDPDDPSKVLLTSIEYPFEECAEGILQYVLAYGDNEDKYVSTSPAGKHYFNLVNECDEIIAMSKGYGTKKKRDEDLERTIKFFKDHCDIEGFHIVEHILLRPKTSGYHLLPIDVSGDQQSADGQCRHRTDPYSFRISVVLPSWPEKFHNVNFRRFVEKTIRRETPAHIFPRICWVDLKQMRDFEGKYKTWLDETAKKKSPSLTAINDLSDILFDLKNIYPVAKLHDCRDMDSDDPQVTLDYSTIGVI
jgi:hypothetical protein